MIRRRIVFATTATTLLLVVLVFLAHRQATDGLHLAGLKSHQRPLCEEELEPLRHLGLSSTIQYRRLCVQAKAASDLKTKSVVHQGQCLLCKRPPQEINLASECSDDPLPPCEDTVTIEYASFRPSHQADTYALLVGASTTLERLNASIPQMARWLANSTSSLIVIIQDSDDYPNLEAVQEKAEAAGIDATLLPNTEPVDGGDRHAQRHFDILHALYTHRSARNKWFAVIDDHTFITSIPALLSALERQYDPTKPYYVGALSEDWHGISRLFGYMAYGGAGMFLSLPLLETLNTNFDACKTAGYEGDKMIADCIYSVTSPPIQLSQLPGLHQLDFFGDVSGWYEAGIKPILSLHHYNGWHHYPVEYGHLIADLCGVDCLLQRYRFADDMVFTNGYSIVQYPRGLQTVDLNRVEGTFMHEKGQFDFSLGALRPALAEKDKVSWRLEYAISEDDGTFRQYYVKRRPEGKDGKSKQGGKEAEAVVDSVIQVDWARGAV